MLIPFLNVSQRLGFVNIPSGNLTVRVRELEAMARG